MKAVIRSYSGSIGADASIIATVRSAIGGAVIETIFDGLRDDLFAGVVGKKGKRFYPADGDAFIEALPFQYSGSFIRAEIVEE